MTRTRAADDFATIRARMGEIAREREGAERDRDRVSSAAGSTGLGRYGGINEDFVLVERWGEGEADGSQEMVEGVGKTLVKAVKR